MRQAFTQFALAICLLPLVLESRLLAVEPATVKHEIVIFKNRLPVMAALAKLPERRSIDVAKMAIRDAKFSFINPRNESFLENGALKGDIVVECAWYVGTLNTIRFNSDFSIAHDSMSEIENAIKPVIYRDTLYLSLAKRPLLFPSSHDISIFVDGVKRLSGTCFIEKIDPVVPRVAYSRYFQGYTSGFTYHVDNDIQRAVMSAPLGTPVVDSTPLSDHVHVKHFTLEGDIVIVSREIICRLTRLELSREENRMWYIRPEQFDSIIAASEEQDATFRLQALYFYEDIDLVESIEHSRESSEP